MRSAVLGARRGEADRREEVDDRLLDLMARYQQPIYSFLLTLLGDADSASDCTQDTFLRAYENLWANRPVAARWLYKVARNRAMDELRRRRKERTDMDTLSRTPGVEGMPGGSIEDVRQALARLSPSDREVLHLFIVDRLKAAEIAAILGIAPTAVRMRISRSRERFRQIYGDAL